MFITQWSERLNWKRAWVLCLPLAALVAVILLWHYEENQQEKYLRLGREGIPFQHVARHSLAASPEWGSIRPRPTNAWWTNLVLGKAAVRQTPYSIQLSAEKGFQIGYDPKRRLASESSVVDPFAADVSLGIESDERKFRMLRADALTATMIQEASRRTISIIMARGSPYITFEVSGNAKKNIVSYWLAGVANIKSSDEQSSQSNPACSAHPACAALLGDCCPTTAGNSLDCCSEESTARSYHGTVFTIVTNDGSAWRLYADPGLTLSLGDQQGTTTIIKHLNGKSPYRGLLRLALVHDDASQKLLDDHAAIIPVSGQVIPVTASEYMFRWQTKHNRQRLLMLALPHHAVALGLGSDTLTPWRCIKGPLSAVVDNEWHLTVPALPSAPLHYTLSSREPATVELLVHADIDALVSIDEESFARAAGIYSAGKRATRLAGLAVAADAIESDDAARTAALATAKALNPWLDPDTKLLAFDLTYGGICTLAGLEDVNADFGNGWYNDHNFHYGYLIYAAAVVCQILGPERGLEAMAGGGDTEIVVSQKKLHRVRAALASLVADVAAPFSGTTDFSVSWWRDFDVGLLSLKLFPPVARHKDFFDGNSWASGLFPMADGKSQESVSEAAHCYYAVALLASALNDETLKDWAMLLAATELQAARYYWHINDAAFDIYPKVFTDTNDIVAVVGAGDISAHVWFGANQAFAHLVNALPFTPLTEHLLLAPYVYRAVDDVTKALESDSDDNLKPWRSLNIQLAAIVDPDAAMRKVLRLSAITDDDEPLNTFALDTTQSLGGLMYWVSTRPYSPPTEVAEENGLGSFHGKSFAAAVDDDDDPGDLIHNDTKSMKNTGPTSSSSAACAEHPKCRNLGMTGDCCPAPGGIQLWCCSHA